MANTWKELLKIFGKRSTPLDGDGVPQTVQEALGLSTEEANDVQIAMFGGRNVGKSSLLAAMYDRFAHTVDDADLQLKLDSAEKQRLAESLRRLDLLFTRTDTAGHEARQSTYSLYSYRFGLGPKLERPSLHLRFIDFPGDWLSNIAEAKRQPLVLDIVKRSAVLLIVIDAAAMMEAHGRYHEDTNCPQLVFNCLQHGFEELESPRLVIFALVKCETYVQDAGRAFALRQALARHYKPHFDLFNSPRLQEKLAVVVTPVQTVGQMVFDRIDLHNDDPDLPDFIFRRQGSKAAYDPRDSEQPLRYLLRFVLRLYYQRQNATLLGRLRVLIDRIIPIHLEEDVLNAMDQFAKGCKSDDLFRVVQGQALLERPD